MLGPWACALYAGAFLALLLTRKTPRAWLWISAGGASFLASSAYWDFGDRHLHPVVTFFCDGLVVALLHMKADEEWEVGVLFAFLISCFVSLLMIGGFVPSSLLYAQILELCNWIALLMIGGVGLTDVLNRHEVGFVRRLHARLHSSRHSLS